MKKSTTRATIAIMFIGQLCLSGDRFQTIAMQGANQTKAINVPANEVAQIVFSFHPSPAATKSFHNLTINKGGITGTFSVIGNLAFVPPGVTPPAVLGALPGPEGVLGTLHFIQMPINNGAKVDHITGAGPIIVGPATMTFANTADANASHKAVHTIRFFPNPNIMGIKQ